MPGTSNSPQGRNSCGSIIEGGIDESNAVIAKYAGFLSAESSALAALIIKP
jgi:hypothetical protein